MGHVPKIPAAIVSTIVALMGVLALCQAPASATTSDGVTLVIELHPGDHVARGFSADPGIAPATLAVGTWRFPIDAAPTVVRWGGWISPEGEHVGNEGDTIVVHEINAAACLTGGDPMVTPYVRHLPFPASFEVRCEGEPPPVPTTVPVPTVVEVPTTMAPPTTTTAPPPVEVPTTVDEPLTLGPAIDLQSASRAPVPPLPATGPWLLVGMFAVGSVLLALGAGMALRWRPPTVAR